MGRRLLSVVGWVVLAGLLVQLYFLARIALMAVVDPTSTTFQRSEMARVLVNGQWGWQQSWLPYAQISDNMKRAVIASEDSDFVNHDGVEWEAIKAARERNAAAQAKAQVQIDRIEQQAQRLRERAQKRIADLEKRGKPVDPKLQAIANGEAEPPGIPKAPQAKIVGGSTISQQLAKNLLLSGERSVLRKGQELLLTQYLELILGKKRILEIYLNNVEFGEGIFGVEGAARYYYKKSASQLGGVEAAKLAVLLPRPRHYQHQFHGGYISSRAGTIARRMNYVELP